MENQSKIEILEQRINKLETELAALKKIVDNLCAKPKKKSNSNPFGKSYRIRSDKGI